MLFRCVALSHPITLTILMDDDLDFGTAVWGATEPVSLSVASPSFTEPSPVPSSTQDGFDDFDDFGAPADTIPASGEEGAEDDFGDFGDFGEVGEGESVPSFQDAAFEEPSLTPQPSADWHPLHVDSTSSKNDLQQQIDELLGPLWSGDDPAHFTDDPIRQAEGLSQILMTRERYSLRSRLRHACILNRRLLQSSTI